MRWEGQAHEPRKPSRFEQASMDLLQQIPYKQSCYVYAHHPACATIDEHWARLAQQRAEAGGEAELKAKVGYWARMAKVEQILAERRGKG